MVFGSLGKFIAGLARTREALTGAIQQVLGAGKVEEGALEDLEGGLLAADLGPSLTAEVIECVRRRSRREPIDADGLRKAVSDVLRESLGADSGASPGRGTRPWVVFVVGVNGGGKTTTVGKLAARERIEGRQVLVVAADTFRAAAVDQLERWAERAGAALLRQADGADPSSVVFDALRAARSRDVDTVLVDTAGRLHTKTNLMAELGKMARIAGREVEGAPHEVLLVLDATTGQNALTQAREFTRALAVTGIVLTKLDGTAKGGVALGIRKEMGVAIRYVGVGEGLDDLLEFDPDAFVTALLDGG